MAAPRNITAELGTTGLRQTGGFLWDEFLSKLQGQNGARVYREMVDNDPVIGAMVFAIGMLVRSCEFSVQAADDSAEAVKWRDRVHGALFEDMEHTWSEFMAEVMTMLPFGYAIHEVVWKVCRGETGNPTTNSKFSDGLLMPRKLAPRAQETVWSWRFNEQSGDVIGFEQFNYNGPNALIPIERCLHFRTTSQRNNPEGRSVLRPAYIPYLRKKVIEDAEGRSALRAAGVVVVELPADYFDPKADEDVLSLMATFRKMATQLAADRQGSVLLPSTRDESGNKLFDVRYVTTQQTNTAELGGIVDRLDKRIAMSVLADFILLGQNKSGGGSYALSTDKTDLFARAIETFIADITDIVNRHLLTRIWKYNGLPVELMPKLQYGSIQTPDLTTLGNYVKSLSGSGATLFPNDELQDALLRAGNLPVTSAVT